jgi:hypothetical protein
MPRSYETLIDEIRQTAYRVYEDDGSLQAASPRAPENTPATAAHNQNTRIRIEIKNATYDIAYTLYLLLEYRINSGEWSPCTTTTPARIANSTHYDTGDPTLTDRLATNTGNYVIGRGVDTQASAGGINLETNQHTECEWNITLHPPIAPGDVVQFRAVALLFPWDGDPDNYTAYTLLYDHYPTLTLTGDTTMAIETVANLTDYGIAIASDETKAYRAVALIDAISADLAPRVSRILTTQGRGSLSPRRALTAQVWTEGSLVAELTPNHAPYLLMLAGYAPTTTGASAPYTHTFKLGTDQPTKSGTVVAWHRNGTPPTHEIYAGLSARRLSLDYNAEAADTLQLTLDLIGLIYGVSQTTTRTDLFTAANPPADAEPPFAQPFTLVELPTGTTLTRAIRASVAIDLQRDLRWTLRARAFARSQQPIRAVRVTGSLTLVFENDADIKRFLNQTANAPYMHADAPRAPEASLRLRATNTLTGSDRREIELLLPSITFTSLSNPKRRDEIVTIDLEFEALYDPTSQSTAQIIVVNSAAAATYADATQVIAGIGL